MVQKVPDPWDPIAYVQVGQHLFVATRDRSPGIWEAVLQNLPYYGRTLIGVWFLFQ